MRRCCFAAAAVRGQLQGYENYTISQRAQRTLGGESVKWDRDVCSLCRVVSGIRADSNVTFSIRKSRFVCITSFVAPEMRQKVYIGGRLQPRSHIMITLLALGIKKKIFSMVLHASRIHVTSAQLPFGSSTRREEKVAKLEGIGDREN